MHICIFFVCFLAAVAQGLAQGAKVSAAGFVDDPGEVFKTAGPFYDFNDDALKPWHLTVSYQLYDEAGKPAEQGTFQYWWASPKVHRRSWSRPGAARSEWVTSDGKYAVLQTGTEITWFEKWLAESLLSPLPMVPQTGPTKLQMKRKTIKVAHTEFPCVVVTPLALGFTDKTESTSYCYDPGTPLLRFMYSFGVLTTGFDRVGKTQGRYLPLGVAIAEGPRSILTAKVDSATPLYSEDPALTPDPNALKSEAMPVALPQSVLTGSLIKKQMPVYPGEAKAARQQGIVVLAAIVGIDGHVHDIQVIESPSKAFTASATEAASHWEYKPYTLDGKLVEVETTITVEYSMVY